MDISMLRAFYSELKSALSLPNLDIFRFWRSTGGAGFVTKALRTGSLFRIAKTARLHRTVCVRAKFWAVPDDLTLTYLCAYYQSTECQRADWKNHKETCRRAVEQRAVLQGIGSALERDKYVDWFFVHRETVYWAIYHGKLYREIKPDPYLTK